MGAWYHGTPAARCAAPRQNKHPMTLHSTVREVTDRIRERSRPLRSAYLQRLTDAYGELFHRYDEAPVLIVDTARFNPVDNDGDFRTLLSRIENMRGRKAFLNLAAP